MSRQHALTAAEDLLSQIPTPRPGTKVCLVDSRKWRTPASDMTARVVGDVRISKQLYRPGYYRFEGVEGFEAYRILGPLEVTALQHRVRGEWRTWMVDDPLHWLSMGELVAQLPPGRILCAGLGLGLMVHWLVRRPDVRSITVVDFDSTVIDVVTPWLPPDPRVSVIHAEWEQYLKQINATEVDAALWDLSVGEQVDVVGELIHAAQVADTYLPGLPLLRWGLRHQSELRP